MSRIRIVLHYAGGGVYSGGDAFKTLEKIAANYRLGIPATTPRWKRAIAIMKAAKAVGADFGRLFLYREPRHTSSSNSRYKQSLRTIRGPKIRRQTRRDVPINKKKVPRSRIARMLEQEFIGAQEGF